jgi:hypothetical protein
MKKAAPVLKVAGQQMFFALQNLGIAMKAFGHEVQNAFDEEFQNITGNKREFAPGVQRCEGSLLERAHDHHPWQDVANGNKQICPGWPIEEEYWK